MKDVNPFLFNLIVWVVELAHGIKSFAAARKIVLSRMKNHSQPNDFSFGAENSGVFRGAWSLVEHSYLP